jgi:biotin carboxylase
VEKPVESRAAEEVEEVADGARVPVEVEAEVTEVAGVEVVVEVDSSSWKRRVAARRLSAFTFTARPPPVEKPVESRAAVEVEEVADGAGVTIELTELDVEPNEECGRAVSADGERGGEDCWGKSGDCLKAGEESVWRRFSARSC